MPQREAHTYDLGMSERAPSYVPVWVQDVLIALFVVVMQVQGSARVAADPANTVLRPLTDLGQLGYLLLVASGAVLVVRRRWPWAVFTVTALVSLTYYALDFPDGPGWLGLFVALYTLTAQGDGRRSLLVAGLGIAVLSVWWLVAAKDVEPQAAIGWVFFRIGASVMSAALGESVRSRRVIAAEAVQRAEVAERTKEDEARARVNAERLRIAREVHDTVAHAIAIINVQAGVTTHVLDRRPEQVREALATIERTSSRALEEMRTILGVLRAADDGRAPHPGLAQVDELAAKARGAGLTVTVDLGETPVSVPSAVGSAAYRVMQEAITNVIRHVGPTRVRIALDYDDEALELRVTDEGRPAALVPDLHRGPTEERRGHGIVGMRERCQLLGGDLDARPVPGGGFEVMARLPLAPSAFGHR